MMRKYIVFFSFNLIFFETFIFLLHVCFCLAFLHQVLFVKNLIKSLKFILWKELK